MTMRTEEEIRAAIHNRIVQLEYGLEALTVTNGPFITRAIQEAVREELQTLYDWASDKEG